EAAARLRKPVLRPPQKHQSAYTSILVPTETEHSPELIAEAAGLLKLSVESLQHIITERTPLPVACTASRDEAELVLRRLGDLGLQTVTLSDDDLGVSSVKRVKTLDLDDEVLAIYQAGTSELSEVAWADVMLIVTGRLFVRTVEIQERKSRRAENEIMHSSEFTSDEAVIDFYTSCDSQTWRVNAGGFDFSCLGPQKTLIANENIARLQRVIASRSTRVGVDDSYYRLRRTLDLVWGAQQETQSSGWRRERPGKLSVGTSAIRSNEIQFTRYSRLRRHFKLER
ncbi:MAG TPA: hypothetical protein VJS17_04715, partial [Pyrinomonadaceae bacterium]|nr:hypothetical protein [Pyrinomonadaceae bacterium]